MITDQESQNTNDEHPPNLIVISRRQAIAEIFKMAIPVTCSRGIIIGQGFIAAIIVSNINQESFAASSLFDGLETVIMSASIASLYSVGANVGQVCGQGNNALAGRVLNQAWIYSGIISAPVIIIALSSKLIFQILRQPESYIPIAQNYFFVYATAIPGILMLVTCQQFMDAIKKPWHDLATTLVNVSITLGLGYGLALGKLGFKPLDTLGLPTATSISAYTTLCGLLLYYKFSASYKDYNIFRNQLRRTFHHLKKLVSLGLPIGLRTFLEISAIFASNIMVGWLGKDDLLAQQSANQYLFLFSIPSISLSVVVYMLVSRAVGEKNFGNARRLGYIGLAMSLVISALFTIVFLFFPESLLSTFIDVSNPLNNQVITLGESLCKVHAVGLLSDTVRNILSGALLGISDSTSALLTSIIGLLAIGIPAGYVLGFVLNLGLLGIYIGHDFGVMLGAGFLLYRWNSQSRNAVQSGELGNTEIFTSCYNSVKTLFRSGNNAEINPPLLANQETVVGQTFEIENTR